MFDVPSIRTCTSCWTFHPSSGRASSAWFQIKRSDLSCLVRPDFGPTGLLHVLRTAMSKWWLQRLVDLTVPNKLKLCKRLRTFGAWHITCFVYVIPLTVFPAVSNGMYGKTSLISPLYQVWFLNRDCADSASVAWGLGNQPPLGVPLILPFLMFGTNL